MLLSWIFIAIDARGHSGGLYLSWDGQKVHSLNIWSLHLGLRMEGFSLKLNKSFNLFNIYGQNENRVPLWDFLLRLSLLSSNNPLLG